MNELQKIDSFRKEIAIAETIEEVKQLTTKGEILAAMAKKLDIPLKGQQELGRTRIELEIKKRDIIEQMFPKGGDRGNQYTKVAKSEVTTLADYGISKDESSNAKIIKNKLDIVALVMDELEGKQVVIEPKVVANEVRKLVKQEEQKQQFEELKKKELQPPTGKYDVIVIDPPWKMEKIERDVAPNQIGFDYPVMDINEIKTFELPAEKDCHIFMWTTHKHLPHGFDIFNHWGVKYVCCFVWHKNGGFQPFGLPQYNCEFILYGRIGTPEFYDFKNFNVCFDAKRTGHSEKPNEFYDTIRRVTAGKRIDIFNRREIDGFDTWGNQAV